jgi:hypothetical protein
MSGGHFDYKQFHINDIIEKLQATIKRIEDPEDDSNWFGAFDPLTLQRIKEAIPLLEIAFIYVHRIDWLLSADDGPEQFHKRLEEEVDQFVDKVNRGGYQ